MILYHSTTRPLIGEPKIKGRCGYGFYLAGSKKDSKTFGDLTYKINVQPKRRLDIVDNEVKGYNFFNMSEESFKEYSSKYDCMVWSQNGRIKEVIVLDSSIIRSRSLI